MKHFTKLLAVMIFIQTTILTLTLQSAVAHDMWLEVRDYTPAVGEELTLTIAYDHFFPCRAFMIPKDIDSIVLLNAKGGKTDIKAFSEVEMKADAPLKEPGTYVIAANNKGGFFTKTTEGYKMGVSKKGLKNVIECSYAGKYTKAIINVNGTGGSAFSNPLGHELEIIPMVDPGTLRQGDYFPIRILLKGSPLPSSQILATYMGFSTEKNTFAYATKTDDKGEAKIKIISSGLWLINTSYVEDYPDADECDKRKFSATLTFEIK